MINASAVKEEYSIGNIPKDINIIIIDDEILIAENISKILKMSGFNNLTVVRKTDEIIDIINDKKFDIYFIDLFMPGYNGNELSKKIIDLDNDSPPKVIIMSGRNDDEAINLIKSCKGSFYLKKPFNADDIINLLNNIYKDKQ
jgi:DNA-binding NtrC family response regulator